CLREDPRASSEQDSLANLLRELHGNPFHPVLVESAWRDARVLDLARVIYSERRYRDMPRLAEELERAGCREPDILSHCRSALDHARGCWVLDKLLGWPDMALNEVNWEASIEPFELLYFIRPMVSARKLRLLACACCRLVWDEFRTDCARHAVSVAENYADG